MKAPTSDQIRDRIDQGKTGEKVSMPDPATVPLGTDAEAGGVSPTPQELKLEARAAPKYPRRGPNLPPGSFVYAALILVVAAAFIILALLALS